MDPMSEEFYEKKEREWAEGPVSTPSIEDVDRISRIDIIGQNGNTAEHYDAIHPQHYKVFPRTEAFDIIKASLTEEEFRGFLKGNFLKYRLRAGFKGDIQEDLDKSHVYRNMLFDLVND